MSLPPGLRLGPYEVATSLGAGGMGEVYRARDPRLGRDVAIKVLPEGSSTDPERLRRFEQEARAAGALNHPNLLAVFDTGQHDGAPFVVFELLEGGTLGHLLNGKPLPVQKALDHAIQIAHGLAAAHEAGIVHRDLKPENLFVTREGRIKILDFGLAKLRPTLDAGDVDIDTPTASVLTGAGTILGTIGYMSPEQVRGSPADHRSDIFSFGSVLYEMLSGGRPFRGETQADTIVAILDGEPPALARSAAGIPPALERVVRRCLEKRPRDRFQSAQDIVFALTDLQAESGPAASKESPMDRGAPWTGWVVPALVAGALAVAGLAGWAAVSSRTETSPVLRRFAIHPPATAPLSSFWNIPLAFSPDGRRLVYTAAEKTSTRLYLRALEEFEPQPIGGTEGAFDPFFSPDGQWVCFWKAGALRKVAVAGGGAITIREATLLSGSWGTDGAFVLGSPKGLFRITAEVGPPIPLTQLDPGQEEVAHLFPEVLPGAQAVLFTIRTRAGREHSRIVAQSLLTGERRVLIEGGEQPRYAPPEHLVYARSGTLFVVRFDARTLTVSGPTLPVLEDVMVGPWSGSTWFTLANDGSLAYVPRPKREAESQLVWVDREGTSVPLPVPTRPFDLPRLSPDGQSVAVQVPDGARYDIWVYRRASETFSRLTLEDSSMAPVWTPDGKRLAYSLAAGDKRDIFWQPADGSTPPERLLTTGKALWPESWSPDGHTLAFAEEDSTTASDIGMLDTRSGDGRPHLLIQGPSDQFGGRVSPDGRWIAYVSEETGRFEVYVQRFPNPGGRRQISTDGGSEVVWARSGRELFYRSPDGLMAAPVTTEPELSVGKSRLLFGGPYAIGPPGLPNYDVTPDGQRFLMVKPLDEEATRWPIHVVEGWTQQLDRRIQPAR